jgi:hypothetical protein
MSDVFYVHWNEPEAMQRARALRLAGHRVRVHWSTQTGAKVDPLPDVLVVSLDRLPSHGRAVAEWMGEARKRQHVPIVFAGGSAEKVAATRARFPHATFCSPDELPRALAQLAAVTPSPAPRGPRTGARPRA